MMAIALAGVAPAQRSVTPIVDMAVGGVIGGVENGNWVSASEVGPLVKKGDRFKWYLMNGVTVDDLAAEDPTPSVPCEDFYGPVFDLSSMTGEVDIAHDGIAFGAGLTWNPMPRTPAEIAETVAKRTYSRTITAILRSKGLTRSVPKNVYAWRIDLEGDGVDEVLLQAGTWGNRIGASAKAGDYSMVVLRKIVAGKVRDFLIGGEFVKRNIEFGAPSRYLVTSIADLNGDGIMEFIVYSEYYEGNSSAAYEMKGGKAVEVKQLQTGCGV